MRGHERHEKAEKRGRKWNSRVRKVREGEKGREGMGGKNTAVERRKAGLFRGRQRGIASKE